MGDEPYYIDLITDTIIDNALDDADRDFNQTIVYGAAFPMEEGGAPTIRTSL